MKQGNLKRFHTHIHTHTHQQYDIVVETTGGHSKGQGFSREQKSVGLNIEKCRVVKPFCTVLIAHNYTFVKCIEYKASGVNGNVNYGFG